nr:MAG TPA: hypothetical protein [Caudoviricetes sp.]
MKYKTTAKAIREGACNIRFAGYCDLQNLLRNHDPVAYTSGVYGWNFDVYEIRGVTICTGYRGMVGLRLEHIAEYENRAENIWYGEAGMAMTWDEKCEAVEKLLREFCKANGGY